MNRESWVLTPADVSKQVGVTKETVKAWADANKLPCWRTPGGHRRFRQSDIDAFLSMGRV